MTIIFEGDPGAIALSKFLLLSPVGVAIVVFVVLLALLFGAFCAYATVTDGNLGF
ncbi:hypothetical protein KW786_01350 [Candidatus Parcubacteria bacterium]|nr:hypothetical protein [Candidatus Parcubacteria bacterium]